MLSADAFSAFEEAGLEDAEAVARTGRAFRDTVLSLGGGRAPAAVFRVRRLGTCPILLTLESFFGQDSGTRQRERMRPGDTGSAGSACRGPDSLVFPAPVRCFPALGQAVARIDIGRQT